MRFRSEGFDVLVDGMAEFFADLFDPIRVSAGHKLGAEVFDSLFHLPAILLISLEVGVRSFVAWRTKRA